MTPSTRRLLADQTALEVLERRLSDCSAVKKFSTENWDEANALTHSLADLEESFDRYARDLLPRLLAPGIGQEVVADVLGEIAEELRHILYHVRDPKFFGHLTDTSDSE